MANTIGGIIKEARINKGMTQKDLAEVLGVSFTLISQYERGERKPKIESLQRIADALDMELNFLKMGEGQTSLFEIVSDTIKHQNKATKDAIDASPVIYGYDPDVTSDERLQRFFESFADTWSYPEFSAFIDDLIAATDEEKRQVWQYIKFLKSQRKQQAGGDSDE